MLSGQWGLLITTALLHNTAADCGKVIEWCKQAPALSQYMEQVRSQKRELIYAEFHAMSRYMAEAKYSDNKAVLYGTDASYQP